MLLSQYDKFPVFANNICQMAFWSTTFYFWKIYIERRGTQSEINEIPK